MMMTLAVLPVSGCLLLLLLLLLLSLRGLMKHGTTCNPFRGVNDALVQAGPSSANAQQ
jgi:hypothetical protein